MYSTSSWRLMQPHHLAVVMEIAAQVHPSYPEDASIFIERHQLYPSGCWIREQSGQACGYLISHPWQLGHPPHLNSMLHQLPNRATTYYLHDIALLPSARGAHAADDILTQLCKQATKEKLDNLSLIAVNQSSGFWQRQHFTMANHLVTPTKLQSYDSSACYMIRHLSGAR